MPCRSWKEKGHGVSRGRGTERKAFKPQQRECVRAAAVRALVSRLHIASAECGSTFHLPAIRRRADFVTAVSLTRRVPAAARDCPVGESQKSAWGWPCL